MNLNEQNVPQAYKDFMANNPNNQMIDLEDKNSAQDYTLYCYNHLMAYNPYDKTKDKVVNYQWLSNADLDFKPLEGDIENIDVALLRTAFLFGSSDGGRLFFHPKTHQIYMIYLDLYVQKIAESFEDFLSNTNRIDEWQI